MPIRDTFKYIARWDSVGLDCSSCIHFRRPEKWPDVKGESCCAKHHIRLRIELLETGYKEGKWFCRSFEDNGTAFPKSVKHFNKIKDQLGENKLYGFYGGDG